MKVRIKKDEKAVIPSYAKEGDAGLDLTCTGVVVGDMYTEYSTGLHFEIPKGFVGLVFPRSSISNKAQTLANSVGVIDSGYRGEVKVRFKADLDLVKGHALQYDDGGEGALYKIGDRVAQLIIIPFPEIEFEEVDDLSVSERGIGGYGSSGL